MQFIISHTLVSHYCWCEINCPRCGHPPRTIVCCSVSDFQTNVF